VFSPFSHVKKHSFVVQYNSLSTFRKENYIAQQRENPVSPFSYVKKHFIPNILLKKAFL